MTGALLGEILVRLVVALALGGALGLERSYHGRPAASARTRWSGSRPARSCSSPSTRRSGSGRPGIRAAIDPTRMAQGLMTGIGFLGAGVIMREGLTVRGLTTAASIWITAGIGILAGIGFFLPAALTTVMALGALSGFRWIERHIRTESYAQFASLRGRSRARQAEVWRSSRARLRDLGRDPPLPPRRRGHGIRA